MSFGQLTSTYELGNQTVGGGRKLMRDSISLPTSGMLFKRTTEVVPSNVLSPGQMVYIPAKRSPLFKDDLWVVSYRPAKEGKVKLYKLEGTRKNERNEVVSQPGIWEDFLLYPDGSGLPALLQDFRVVRPQELVGGIYTRIISPIILPGSEKILETVQPFYSTSAIQFAIDTFLQGIPPDLAYYQDIKNYDEAVAAAIIMLQTGQDVVDSASASFDSGMMGVNSFRICISAGLKIIQFAADFLMSAEAGPGGNPVSLPKMQKATDTFYKETDLILQNISRADLYSISNVAWNYTTDAAITQTQFDYVQGMSRALDDPEVDKSRRIINYTPEKVEHLKMLCEQYMDEMEPHVRFQQGLKATILSTIEPVDWSGFLDNPDGPIPHSNNEAILGMWSGYLTNMIRKSLFAANLLSDNNPLGPAVRTKDEITLPEEVHWTPEEEEMIEGLSGMGALGTRRGSRGKKKRTNQRRVTDSQVSKAQKKTEAAGKRITGNRAATPKGELISIQGKAATAIKGALARFSKLILTRIEKIFEGTYGEKLTGLKSEDLSMMDSSKAKEEVARLQNIASDAGLNLKDPAKGAARMQEWFDALPTHDREGRVVFELKQFKEMVPHDMQTGKVNYSKYKAEVAVRINFFEQIAKQTAQYLVDGWVMTVKALARKGSKDVRTLMDHLNLIADAAATMSLQVELAPGDKNIPKGPPIEGVTGKSPWLAQPTLMHAFSNLVHNIKKAIPRTQMNIFLQRVFRTSNFTVQEFNLSVAELVINKTETVKDLRNELAELQKQIDAGKGEKSAGSYKATPHRKRGSLIFRKNMPPDASGTVGHRRITNYERKAEIIRAGEKGIVVGELAKAKEALREAVELRTVLDHYNQDRGATKLDATFNANRANTTLPPETTNQRRSRHEREKFVQTEKQKREEGLTAEEALRKTFESQLPEGISRDQAWNTITAILARFSPFQETSIGHSAMRDLVTSFFTEKTPQRKKELLDQILNDPKLSDKPITVTASDKSKREMSIPEALNELQAAFERAEELHQEITSGVDKIDVTVERGQQGDTFWKRDFSSKASNEAGRARFDTLSHHYWTKEKALELEKQLDIIEQFVSGQVKYEKNRNAELVGKPKPKGILEKITEDQRALELNIDKQKNEQKAGGTWRSSMWEATVGVLEWMPGYKRPDKPTWKKDLAYAGTRLFLTGTFWFTGVPQTVMAYRSWKLYSTKFGGTTTGKMIGSRIVTGTMILPMLGALWNVNPLGSAGKALGFSNDWIDFAFWDSQDPGTHYTELWAKGEDWATVWGILKMPPAIADGLLDIFVGILPGKAGVAEKTRAIKKIEVNCSEFKARTVELEENVVKELLLLVGASDSEASDIAEAIEECDGEYIYNNLGVWKTLKDALGKAVVNARELKMKGNLAMLANTLEAIVPDPTNIDPNNKRNESTNSDEAASFLSLAWKLAAIGAGIWFLQDPGQAIAQVKDAWTRITGIKPRTRTQASLVAPSGGGPGRHSNVPKWITELAAARAAGAKGREKAAIAALSKARDRGFQVHAELTPQVTG